MKKYFLFFLFFLTGNIIAQQKLNLGFELLTPEKIISNWKPIGQGYDIKVDDSIKYAGKKSLKVEKTSVGDFGGVGIEYPISKLKGKHIRLSGWIKTKNVTNGYAGLWMRIDGKLIKGVPEQLGFDNMNGRGPAGTTSWTKYFVDMDVNIKAEKLLFGALSTGSGISWFDNLELKVIEENNAKPETKPSSKIKIVSGDESDLFAANQIAVRNLRAFAKLYGYVRFFHPSDEASNIDWNKFAVYGSEKVKNSKNNYELKETLEKLFSPIAPTAQIYFSNERTKDFSEYFPKDTAGLKIVAWQHKGVGLINDSPIYRSIRINRNNGSPNKEDVRSQSYGHFYQFFDAKNYRGREIKLVASVKANVEGNSNNARLWLRIDNENKQNGFLDNMTDRPITSNIWKDYEIVGSVASDAERINYGGLLSGKGMAWFDNFRFYFKDADETWRIIKIQNPSFEEITANNKPVYWGCNSQSYNYTLVENEKSDGDKSLLVSYQPATKAMVAKLFEKYPLPGESINKEIAPGLLCKIPLALYSKENVMLGANKNNLIDSLKTKLGEIEFGQYCANNEYVRLGDVINAWNVFQHFYPYFEEVKVDWDNVLTETLTDALNDKTSDQFYNTLRKMIAKLQDGHGYVNYIPQQKVGSIPLSVGWIQDKLVITGTQDSLFQKGDIIEKIDDIPGNQALLNEEKYVSGSPQLRRHRALNEICDGPLGSTATFQIIRDGKKINVQNVRGIKKGNLFFNNVREFELPSFKKIEEGIYYINLNAITNKQFNDSLLVLAKAKGIIFDKRASGNPPNPSEAFQPSEMIQYLTNSTVHSAWWNVPQTIYPDRKGVTYDSSHWTIPPKEPRVIAKIIFINVPSVVSYGESYMGIFEHYKLAEFVGEPTAGTNGNVNFINLPGGFNIMWTGMKVVKQDGSQHHLIGIQPTYPVQRTIKAVKDGRDEYLEKAIEILRSKINN